MNGKAIFGFILIIAFVLIGSYFATTSNLFQGSVFKEPSNFNTIKVEAERGPKTPTDYVVQKLTLYMPPEEITAASNFPDDDSEVTENGTSLGNVSKTISASETGTYFARVIISNLGTTVAALPQIKVDLNGTVISDISGVTEFSRVTNTGMELRISVKKDADYIKPSGSNELKVSIDPEDLIKESKENNNLASLKF